MITINTLRSLGVSQKNAARYVEPLNTAADLYDIITPTRLAHFVSRFVFSSNFSGNPMACAKEAGLVWSELDLNTLADKGLPGVELISGRLGETDTTTQSKLYQIAARDLEVTYAV